MMGSKISNILDTVVIEGVTHGAHIEQVINHTKYWLENLKVKDHSEDLGIMGI